jgi:hypothetical protein
MRKDNKRSSERLRTSVHDSSHHSEGYMFDNEDEYGIIRTGARGPKQTPIGTIVFIMFLAIFIIFLMLFLVAFMTTMFK